MRRFTGLLGCLFVLLFLYDSTSVLAHPGKTDGSGGHYDNSTGEYHYHHGYPAHYHYDIDGDGKEDCPYDFNDRTGWNSGNSSSNSYYSDSQFSNSYLDGYSEGHEAGYFGGYRDGKSTGYSSGYDVGYDVGYDTGISDAKSKAADAKGDAYITSGCIGGGVLLVAGIISGRRKENDGKAIVKRDREISEKDRQLKSLKTELDKANTEIAKKDQDVASQYGKLQASTLKIVKLEHLLEGKLGVSTHNNLVEIYGDDYLYVLSKAPNGDYLDESDLPHSRGTKKFLSSDRYAFYLGGTASKPTTRYHSWHCRYANTSLLTNAYTLQKSSNYIPCASCRPNLPDVSWVDRYIAYRKAMQESMRLAEDTEETKTTQ